MFHNICLACLVKGGTSHNMGMFRNRGYVCGMSRNGGMFHNRG